MSATPIIVPQFDLPFRFVGGTQAALVEQDTLAEITDCVEAILRTPIGSRAELPDFGVPDQTFTEGGDVDLNLIIAAVQQWEPRATIAATLSNQTLTDYVAGVLIQVQGGA